MIEDNRIFDVYATLAVLRTLKKYILYQYLLTGINSLVCKTQFNKHLIEIGGPNLYLNVIKEVLISLPLFDEQSALFQKFENCYHHFEVINIV